MVAVDFFGAKLRSAWVGAGGGGIGVGFGGCLGGVDAVDFAEKDGIAVEVGGGEKLLKFWES